MTLNSSRGLRGPLRYGALAVGAILALATIAACGSSSKGTSSGSSTPGATAPTKAEIRIGTVGDYTGSNAANVAITRPVTQAWAEWVNAHGGIDGHPVKLFIEDDASIPAQSVTAVKKLVEQDKVVAIVGPAANGGDTAWASYVASKGIPVIGGTGVDAPYLSDPNFFSGVADLITWFYGIAAVAKTNGPKIGALYCSEAPACAQVVTLMQGLGPSVGLQLAYSAKIAAATPDYTAACQGLKEAGVQSYNLSVSGPVALRVANQCVQQGLTAHLVSTPVDQTYASVPGFEGAQFVNAEFPFFDESTPATQEFHAALKKYAPEVGTAAMPLSYNGARAWISGKLFEAAVKNAPSGPITSESLKQGLYNLKDETLGGLTGPLNFKPGKVSLQHCYFVFKIEKGKFVTPQGLKMDCAPDAVINAVLAKLAG